MRGLLVIVFLIVLVAAAIYLARWHARMNAYRAAQAARWVVETHNWHNETYVRLVKPGEDPYLIGHVPITLPHWEHQDALAGLLLEAEEKADSLNLEQGRVTQ